MAIITFMSDFGYQDHYVAAVKARIYKLNPGVKVVDISHMIEPHNIAHAAFVLNAVFRDFPIGTIHLVAVDTQNRRRDKLVAAKIEEHLFVGADNGLFSLLSDKASVAVELNYDKSTLNSFPDKQVLAPAAVALASGSSLYDLGHLIKEGLQRKLNPQLRITKNSISGQVIHVDGYGNLITNITLDAFKKVKNDREYVVRFGRYTSGKIFDTYARREEGDEIVIFNSMELLEIAQVNGNAARLFGLSYSSPITINFTPEIE